MSRINKILIVILVFILSINISYATGVLDITVQNANGELLPNVNIVASTYSRTTDANGHASVTLAKGTTHTLRATLFNYTQYRESGIIINDGQTTYKNVIMNCTEGIIRGCTNGLQICSNGKWGNCFNTYKDYCLDENTLVEYFVDGNSINSENYVCKEGCNEGICKPDLTLTVATLKKQYSVGEQVLLTDPPITASNNLISGDIIKRLSLITGASVFGKLQSVAQYLLILIIFGILIYYIVYLFKNQKKLQAYITIGIFVLILLIPLIINLLTTEKSLESKFSDFKDKYGENWKIEDNNLTNAPHIISGFNIIIKENITNDNIDKLSKDFISKNKDLFKINTNNLEITKVSFDSPVYSEHTQGIDTITYMQTYQEIPVYKSLISVTYINGKLTQAITDYYPNIDVSSEPTVTKEEALEIVKKDLGLTNNIPAKNISLWIFPKELEDKIEYHLTWKVEMPVLMLKTNTFDNIEENDFYNQNPELNAENQTEIQLQTPEEKPSQWVYFVDAHTNLIVYKYNDIIYDTLTGTVSGMIYSEYTSQDQIQINFGHNIINTNEISGVSDINGNYEISGLTGSVNINSNLEGPYVKVVNGLVENIPYTKAQYTSTATAPGTNSWNWKDYDTSDRQEESNLFYHLNIVHDFFAARESPFDIHDMDYQSVGEVQTGAGAYHCNAYADGTNTHFYGSGNNCENTALLSDIIYHEYTHLVTRHLISDFPYWDETGNMNEGFSDYFSSSINNNPCVSEGFRIGQGCLRNIKNIAKYPENYNPEPHQVLFSGALWDLREVIGQELNDNLIIRTMKLQPHSFTEFIDFMLIVDDNNGDLIDGTPHVNEICHAFYDLHGLYSPNCVGYTEKPIAVITSPQANRLNLFGKEILTIQINGNVYGSKLNPLQNYIIEYANVDNQEVWFSSGVTLNGGEIINGILGEIDVSIIASGKYNIKLTAKDIQNNINNYFVTIIIDKDIKDGWPISIISPYLDYKQRYPLKIGDIDNDGDLEILIGTYWDYGKIYAYHHDGSIVNGWPKINEDYKWDRVIETPALGDIDGDGNIEIIVSRAFSVDIYNYNGDLVNTFTPSRLISSSPILEDLDGDGDIEIIVGEFSGIINAYHHDGTLVNGWPININTENENIEFSTAFASGDIDGDSDPEVVIGYKGKGLYIFNHDGSIVNGWPKQLNILGGKSDFPMISSPTLADLDGDGDIEIIMMTYKEDNNYTHIIMMEVL